ncbi:MAG: sigma-70 family RNA polymerase sigma factor [Oscillospiraceae bacterium]|nr:sigma-70 family RNA polymerase sigma factor [Oscillospiraceae bacterium]
MNNLLQHLWERHHERLYAVAYRILLNRQDSEDAVSEAFLKLSENIDRYSELDENQLLALLTTITKNIARDKLKLKRENVSLEDCEPSDSQNVEESALSSENVRIIKREIENLGSTYSGVVSLRLCEEKSFREISHDLDITEAAARKRYQRGLELLKKRLLLILLILISCILLLGMIHRPIREALGEWTACHRTDYTTIYLSSTGDYPSEILEKHEPTCGVDGHERTVTVDGSVWYAVTYTQGESNLYYMQYTADTFRYTDVSKDYAITETTVNGSDALCMEGDSYAAVMWADDEYTYLLEGDFEKDEIIKIAESVK